MAHLLYNLQNICLVYNVEVIASEGTDFMSANILCKLLFKTWFGLVCTNYHDKR